MVKASDVLVYVMTRGQFCLPKTSHTGAVAETLPTTKEMELVFMIMNCDSRSGFAFSLHLQLGLYNLIPEGSWRSRIAAAKVLFPMGKKVAIFEPFYKTWMDGMTGVRVDNPTEVGASSIQVT